MKAKLPLPVHEVLRDDVDESLVRRAMPATAIRRRRDLRVRAQWALAAALLAAVVVLYARSDDGGALRSLDGAVPTVIDAPTSGDGAHQRFSDGSVVSVAPGGRVAPLALEPRAAVFLLERGTAMFDVTPGGSRRWSVECGLLTVEVIGTRFVVERRDDAVTVRVERGEVLVRGERVPDRIRRLGAGETVTVRDALASAHQATDDGASDPALAQAPRTEATAQPATATSEPSNSYAARAESRVDGRKMSPADAPIVEDGAPDVAASARPASEPGTSEAASDAPLDRGRTTPRDRVPAQSQISVVREDLDAPEPGSRPADVPPPRPTPRERAPVEYESNGAADAAAPNTNAPVDRLARADAARRARDYVGAVAELEAILAQYPPHPQSALAAFTLGAVELDDLNRPERALAAFDTAIARGIPILLREDAYARRVEAFYRLNDVKGSQAAAAAYFARYPDGRRAALVRKWSSAP